MNFIGEARRDEHVNRMYGTDLRVQGYVANQTRVWAHSPETMAALTYALSAAVEGSGLDARQRALLVTTTAATMGDAYCALAFGLKLAGAAGEEAAVRAVTGDDTGLDAADLALVRWARRVVRDPSGTEAADVAELTAAGFDDGQVVAITVFVALRQAFATVNDALGAEPDAELLARVPAALRDAAAFGRLSLPARA